MIFAMLKRELPKDELVDYGTLVEWVGSNKNQVCMVCFPGLVSLTSPSASWAWDRELILDKIKDGELKVLSKGTIVTLSQE